MDHLKSDKEVFLWLSEHFPKKQGKRKRFVMSFQHASQTLKTDKAFMLKAIALNPNVYHTAPQSLKNDFDVWLLAVGGTAGQHPLIDQRKWTALRETFVTFIARVRAELQNYETYQGTFLFGMTQQQPDNALTLLSQGEATSLNYKRLVAEYLDVPTGKRLRMLRKAVTNLVAVFETVAGFD